MNEMITIEQDFSTPVLDDQLSRSRISAAKKKKRSRPRKTVFIHPKFAVCCFGGREEINYENI